MSYDVTVGDHWSNYTSNLRPFFDHFGVPIRELEGVPGRIMADRIDAALARIIDTPLADLTAFNADNGWGKWTTAMNWLVGLRDAGRQNPDATVEVSA